MQQRSSTTVIGTTLLIISLTLPTFGISEQANFSSIELFYVGGAIHQGEYRDQALVHALKADTENKIPVIFYPGLGLTSYIWLATPDGREGWAQEFARAGYPAYVFDPVQTGPSGIAIGPLKEGSVPLNKLNKWDTNSVWRFFGFGAKPGEPYPDSMFPSEKINQLHASYALRVGDTPGRGTRMQNVAPSSGFESANHAALLALLQRTGPAVFVIHSFAGRTVYPLAGHRPDLVKAIIAVETDGCPSKAQELRGITKIPYLSIYGDYLETRGQKGRMTKCQMTADLISKAGSTGTLWELPKQGIKGNSHNLMQDRNSGEIASMAIHWLGGVID